MVGKIISLNEANGRLFEFSEEATLDFSADQVVGDLSVGDMANFDIAWDEKTRYVTNIRKKEA